MANLRRRRLQFGLGTLLLAVTLFGIWLGIVANKVNKQRQAVAAIGRLGGRIEFDYEFNTNGDRIPNVRPPGPAWLRKLLGDDCFRKVILVDLAASSQGGGSKLTDADLACLASLADVKVIHLDDNPGVTDAGLVHLRNLNRLQYLSMRNANVTGAGYNYLTNKPHLRLLDIPRTPLSRDGVVAIGKLPTLKFLCLRGTHVTDEDLTVLASLRNLTQLELNNTQVTDRGLQHLERLTELQSLSLPAGISDEALNRLEKALPNCPISCGNDY